VVLAELARSNMFLVALDANGEWYRYHHLFGELLQLELGGEEALVRRRRAAAWCRAQGLVEDAIEYAAAAGDAETVAELLVEHDRAQAIGRTLARAARADLVLIAGKGHENYQIYGSERRAFSDQALVRAYFAGES